MKRIPRSVYSVLGRIPVRTAANLPDATGKPTDDMGQWDAKEREITLRDDLSEVTAWQTLLHEKVHVWLGDAGVALPAPYEEAVCDVISTALLAEMLNAS